MEEQQPEKTTAETTTQQTLLYQMEHKYFCPEDEDRSTAEETYILDIFGSSPCKAAHENVLELLVLDNLGISGIGPVNRLCSLAGKVTELDLNGNSLDWPAVGQLLAALPQLRTLNLSHNQLLSQAPQPSLPTALNLTTLILNGLPMPMGTLSAVCQAVPSLKELHLSKGHFPDLSGEAATTASVSVPISSTLQELHLNDCGLREWCQVLAMMRLFSRLQTLFLADNQIASVDQECQCGLATAELSTQMRSLSLSNNRISGWESIENLETLDRLEELRVAHIPLLEDFSAEERLHLIVGRLRSLQVLNGSRIDARQREESERFFIRYYAQSEKKPLIYDQLVAEHGMLDELVRVDLTPKRFAKVAIHCEETDWVRMWIRLRLTGTVLELMKMAARLTNIPLRLMRIFYVDKYLLDVLGPTELRSTQHLKMLHVEDGDEFYVQSKLVWVQESATAKNRQSAQQPAAERQLHQEATATTAQ